MENSAYVQNVVNLLEIRLGRVTPEEIEDIEALIDAGFGCETIIYSYDIYRKMSVAIGSLWCYYDEYKTTDLEGFKKAVDAWDEIWRKTKDVYRHIDGKCAEQDVLSIHDWIKSGLDVDCIKHACDVCFEKTGEFKVAYIEKILENWCRWGCKTIEDVKASEIRYENKNKQKKEVVKYKDENHKKNYATILAKMATVDVHHACMAYLLSLDERIAFREDRVGECFDFEEDTINPPVLEANWVSDTDRRILALAFSLWKSSYTAPISDVFTESENVEYLFDAIRIRLGMVPIPTSEEQK